MPPTKSDYGPIKISPSRHFDIFHPWLSLIWTLRSY